MVAPILADRMGTSGQPVGDLLWGSFSYINLLAMGQKLWVPP